MARPRTHWHTFISHVEQLIRSGVLDSSALASIVSYLVIGSAKARDVSAGQLAQNGTNDGGLAVV